jgi:hypothetical protein
MAADNGHNLFICHASVVVSHNQSQAHKRLRLSTYIFCLEEQECFATEQTIKWVGCDRTHHGALVGIVGGEN